MWIIVVILAILLLLAFLLFPAMRHHPDLKRLKGAFIAHRGLHDQVPQTPENSLAACRLAVEHGYPIENDIHITADGEIVVFHDESLERVCHRTGIIEDMTLAELRECRLGDSDEPIPTLREFLDTVDGKVDLLIEFKCGDKPCRRLCEEADRILSDYQGTYFIQSFYPQVLMWYRKHRPTVCRGQLASGFYHDKWHRRLLGCLVSNVVTRPDFISYDQRNQRNLFFRLTSLLGGYPIGWTFRSREEIDKGKKRYNTYIFENFIPKG